MAVVNGGQDALVEFCSKGDVCINDNQIHTMFFLFQFFNYLAVDAS